jgi:branched-chain amino acid transport system permease protein
MFLNFLMLGIINGGIYALIAVGLSLLFGVLQVINVSHGEWVTFGGYAAVVLIAGLALNPFLGILGAGIGGCLLSVGIYFLLISPLRKRMETRPPGPTYLVLTLGLSMFLQNSFILIASPNFLTIPPSLPGVSNIFGVLIQNQRLLIFGIAALLLIGFFMFLKKAKLGMAIRAVAQNPTAALCSGIDPRVAFAACFGIAGICTGIGGALIGSALRVYPTFGFELLLKGFAVTVIGGLGNLVGSLVAAYLIGIAESLAVMWLPMEWKSAVSFVFMVFVLIIRPRGLFGKEGQR